MNARLDEIQAAVLRAKLPHLEAWNSQRRANAAHYTELLSQVRPVVPPFTADYAEHVFHLYVLRVPDRDRLAAFLHDRGIGAGIHYPVPCHLQPALAHLGYRPGDLPVTESLAGEVISLPMYPELTAEQRAYVAAAIEEFYHQAGPVDVPRLLQTVAG